MTIPEPPFLGLASAGTFFVALLPTAPPPPPPPVLGVPAVEVLYTAPPSGEL